MTKTPAKMVKYLKKIDDLGLKQVRVIVPAQDEGKITELADDLKLAYLRKIARNADDNDPRLAELAESRLATAVRPVFIAGWRRAMPESQHIHFDKKVLTMTDLWEKMVLAVQGKNAAMMRGDDAEAKREGANAAVAAMAYRAAKDDVLAYVRLHVPQAHITAE
jgi:hypothetical protein